MTLLEFDLISRQIANLINRMMDEAFDPQQAVQEAIEQYGELHHGWDAEFAQAVYHYIMDKWVSGLLSFTVVEDAIKHADQ